MKIGRLLPLILLILVFVAVGCKEEIQAPRLASLDIFYPLELNRAVFYQVDSVVLFGTVGGIRYDSSRTEARETLVESFVGNDGERIYRGERWERKNDAQPFRYKRAFSVRLAGGNLQRTEDNLTFTKLVSPVRKDVNWDGNAAFNDRREVPVGGEFLTVYRDWAYRYTVVDTSVVLRTDVTLDSVTVVQQASITDNSIEYRVAYEWYAPGIGLVERFIDARDTQCKVCCQGDGAKCNALPWDEKAEQGYIIHQTFLRRD